MRRFAFAIPGDLAAPTGGYGYARRMIAELRERGWEAHVVALGDGFPKPAPEQKRFAQARLAAVPADRPLVIDGLAFGVLPEAAEALSAVRPLVALVHHPLAWETGVTADEARALHASETAALARTRAVIVSSPATARLLASGFEVPAVRITVAVPGTDRAPFACGGDGAAVRLVSVGAVVPRKGFDLLVEALARLRELPWHLTIAGDRTRDPDAAARLDALIAQHGLQDRVAMAGAVSAERISALLSGADLFVLASHYEGYGMAYAEAIAHGLPVIGTTAGAVPETVPGGAGILVPPGDVEALAPALRWLIEDRDERARLAAGARAAAQTLPTWRDSARLFAGVLENAA